MQLKKINNGATYYNALHLCSVCKNEKERKNAFSQISYIFRTFQQKILIVFREKGLLLDI